MLGQDPHANEFRQAQPQGLQLCGNLRPQRRHDAVQQEPQRLIVRSTHAHMLACATRFPTVNHQFG